MSYDHVVIATDFSELSERAVDAGKRLALRFGSRVSLVHSHQFLPPAPYPGILWNAELDAQQRADAQRALAALQAAQFADFEGVETQVLPHPNAAISICDYAAENAGELIVVGTHGRTGLGHFLIGSVAEAVVRHAPCATMVVRPAFELSRFPQHLLVCTDFSPASKPALEAASELARAFEPRVTLLHAYPEPPLLPGMKTKPYRALEHVDEELRQALTALEREHFGGAVTTALLAGPSPYEVIVGYALRHRADLVVMATHGRTGLARLLMGSVAERVVRHAPCPVLVARSGIGNDAAG